MGADPARHRRRRRSRGAGRAQGIHLGRLAEADRRRSAARCCASSAIWSPSTRKFLAEIEVRDNGKLIAEMSAHDGVHGAVVPLLRRPRRQDRGRGHSDRQARHLQLHALRAARRRRRDRPVEFAAPADGVEAGAGAGRRQHDRHQAVRVHVGVAARVHEARRAGRLPAGRRQRRHRLRAGSRDAAGRASARREGRVHRLRRHRTARLRGRRARTEARQHGARRQVAQHRVRRCRTRQRGERRRLGHLRRDGTDLHRRLAAARAEEHPRSVRREAGRVRANGEDGQSDEPRHAGRPDHQQAAVREGAELHRYRQVGGRDAAARRPSRVAPPNAATAGSSSRRSSPA